MLILGIETSTRESDVALRASEGSPTRQGVTRDRDHLEKLMISIFAMLERAGRSLDRLTGIAVGLGPGSFTSMRVGIATAKTIAQVLDRPIVGICSLDALAFGARAHGGTICACIEASRGEVFAATYRATDDGVRRLTEPRAVAPSVLSAELQALGEPVAFVGQAALDSAAELRAGEILEHPRFPSATWVCELALAPFERGDHVPVARLEPMYVRRTDAEIRWEERGVVIERPFRVKVSKKATR
jgi:tRNA threonylcarbamoyladenosine biosynthesis protein TsaB